MTYECFQVEIADHVAHIRFSRPEKANTMIRAFWNELPGIVRDIDRNARARVIVLSAEGKHFSGGMDLGVFAEGQVTGASGSEPGRARLAVRDIVKHLQGSFSCLDEAQMPVLAAIQGACVGGAVDLISACDIRYATQDAFFGIEEINIGMTADVGTFPRLCHLIPQGWLRELAYTGRRLDARTAERIGLVNRVFETQAQMLEYVMETAREIASKTPLAVTGSKTIMNYARDHSIADTLDYLAVWQSGMFHAHDMAEAFTARSEGRAAEFEDMPAKPTKM